MMVDCLTLLLTGDILTGLACPFTNQISFYFFAIMLAATEIGIAIRYDNIMAPALLGLFSGIAMISVIPPEAYMIPLFIFIVNGGAVLYNVFIRD